jgi:hypothetical protein
VIRESQHLPIADSLLALVAEIGIDGSELRTLIIAERDRVSQSRRSVLPKWETVRRIA